MGYRRLLKTYLAYVEQLLGTNLVEPAAASKAFSRRDLGELSAIAAELAREKLQAAEGDKSTKSISELDYGGLIARSIRDFGFDTAEAARAIGVDEKTLTRWCYGHSSDPAAQVVPAEFTRALAMLVVAHAKNGETAEEKTEEHREEQISAVLTPIEQPPQANETK